MRDPGQPARGRSRVRSLDVPDALHEVELFRVRLPLVTPFRTAHDITAHKDALLVRVRTDAGVGWGECTAQVAPSYAPDTIDTARLVLRDELIPRAFSGAPLDAVRGHQTARTAFDCALLDARLRADGVSLAAHLGARRSFVPGGVAIGLTDSCDELRRLVVACAEQGYERVKCKIAPGYDVEPLRHARAELGDHRALAADANGSYDLDGARKLIHAVDDLDLQCLEQPLAAGEMLDHAELARHATTPVCLDESVSNADDAELAIHLGAAQVISIKPGRTGSVADLQRMHDACVRGRVDALAGGMLETGVGRAFLLAVAALPGFAMTGDCSASDRYFGVDGDLTEPFVLERGRLRVPSGPGLGVEPRPDRLAQCTVAHERITRS